MAESVFSVIQKLAEQLSQEVSLLCGVESQVRSLHDQLEQICAFLKDADQQSLESEGVKFWISRLRQTAYEAEDVIDTFIQQQHQQRSSSLFDVVKRYVGCAIGLVTLHRVATQVEGIKGRLHKISEDKKMFDIKITKVGEPSGSSNQSRLKERRPPVVEEANVVGFKDDEEMIAKQLTREENRRLVVSIVGMGGQGKTTLAKKVYNRSDVKSHFDCHAWIYVSQEYQVKELLKSIIKSVMGLLEEETNKSTSEELLIRLSTYLKGKRYLVVVDDIWTKEAWADLSLALPDAMNGSRVMLTTRIKEVALEADQLSTPYPLRFLTQDESWELFCKKTFLGNVPSEFPSYLEKIGRELVAKCDRLPLAIVVLGGMLSKKEKVPSEWEKVLKSAVWRLNEGPDQISSILALSYHDLPYYLKPCFLYFGIFPEDSIIDVDDLIQMWIAEGFVQRRGEEEIEDVAEEWLVELIDRSMVQVGHTNADGTVVFCQIHDLLRDLSISKANESRFLNVFRAIEPSASQTTARRLAITDHDLGEYLSLNHAGLQLRSLLCSFSYERKKRLGKQQLKTLCRGFKLIRVLKLENVSICNLPNEIGYLVHLRYLMVEGEGLKALPNTISCLYNLQALSIWSDKPVSLPRDTWKMQQLRHLSLPHKSTIEHAQLHRWSNLQTLRDLNAGRWIKESLDKLTSLRDLTISGDLIAYEKSLSNSLSKLASLRKLGLHADVEIPPLPSFSNHHCLYEIFLGGRLLKPLELHEFPPHLCELFLRESQLDQDPMEVLGKLIHLRSLNLRENSFIGKEMVSSVGGFPQLETLAMFELKELEEWKIEEGAMPNLKNLQIGLCEKLKMLPEGLQHITTLQDLLLVGMAEDFKGRVREREGEDWHKIQHIPSLTIWDKPT